MTGFLWQYRGGWNPPHLMPVEKQRGAVEDGGQAGFAGAFAYGVPDDGQVVSAFGGPWHGQV